MPKNFRKFRDFEYDEDRYDDNRGHRDELKERRRIKKMKNALKARNIDQLLDIDDV